MRVVLWSLLGASLVSSLHPGLRSLLELQQSSGSTYSRYTSSSTSLPASSSSSSLPSVSLPSSSSSFSSLPSSTISSTTSSSSVSSNPSSSSTSFEKREDTTKTPKLIETTAGSIVVNPPTPLINKVLWGNTTPQVGGSKVKVEEEDDDDETFPAATTSSLLSSTSTTSSAVRPSKAIEEDEDEETESKNAELMRKGVEAAKSMWKTIQTTAGPQVVPSAPIKKSIFDKTSDTVENVKTSVASNLDNTKTAISSAVDNTKSTLSSTAEKAASSISSTANDVKASVAPSVDNAKSSLSSATDSAKSSLSSAMESAKSSISSTVEKVASLVTPSKATEEEDEDEDEDEEETTTETRSLQEKDKQDPNSIPKKEEAEEEEEDEDEEEEASLPKKEEAEIPLETGKFGKGKLGKFGGKFAPHEEAEASIGHAKGKLNSPEEAEIATPSSTLSSPSSTSSATESSLSSSSVSSTPPPSASSLFSSLFSRDSSNSPASTSLTGSLGKDSATTSSSDITLGSEGSNSTIRRSAVRDPRFAAVPKSNSTSVTSTPITSTPITSTPITSTPITSATSSSSVSASVNETKSASTGSSPAVEDEDEDEDEEVVTDSSKAPVSDNEEEEEEDADDEEEDDETSTTTPSSPVGAKGKVPATAQEEEAEEEEEDEDEDDEEVVEDKPINLTPPSTSTSTSTPSFSLSKPFSPDTPASTSSTDSSSSAGTTSAPLVPPPAKTTTAPPSTSSSSFSSPASSAKGKALDEDDEDEDEDEEFDGKGVIGQSGGKTLPASSPSSSSSASSTLTSTGQKGVPPTTAGKKGDFYDIKSDDKKDNTLFGQDLYGKAKSLPSASSTTTSATTKPAGSFGDEEGDEADEGMSVSCDATTFTVSNEATGLQIALVLPKDCSVESLTVQWSADSKFAAIDTNSKQFSFDVAAKGKKSVTIPESVLFPGQCYFVRVKLNRDTTFISSADPCTQIPSPKGKYVAVRVGVVFKPTVLELELKPPRLWDMLNTDLATALTSPASRFEMSQFSDARHVEFQILPSTANSEPSPTRLAERLSILLQSKNIPKGILTHIESLDKSEIVAACADGSFAKTCAGKLETYTKTGSNWTYYAGGIIVLGVLFMYCKRRSNASATTKTVHGAKFNRIKTEEEVSPTARVSPGGESATEFVERVLGKLGIPGYGMAKYTNMLKDKHLHTMEQLRAMDDADWKAVGLPPVIESGLKEALTGRSAPPTKEREVRTSGGMELTRPKPLASRLERVEEPARTRPSTTAETASANPTDAWDLDMPDDEPPPSPVATKEFVSSKKTVVIPEEKDPEAPNNDSELTSDKPVAPKTKPKPKTTAKSKSSQKKGMNEVQEEGDGWMDMDDF